MLKIYETETADKADQKSMLYKSKLYKYSYFLLLVTVFINVTFPKAGIKLKGIPLTVGNVFLMLTVLVWAVFALWSRRVVFSKAEVFVAMGCVYWAGRFLFAFAVGGGVALADIVGYVVPTVIYPFIFFVFNFFVIDKKQIEFIVNMLLVGTIIVFVFGYLQAVFGIDAFTIPGVTVNYTDYSTSTNWYADKYNGVVGDVTYAKTVSSYQNGNLLGVNIMLFCPMVCESIKNKYLRHVYLFVFAMFCVLTGSKTCWVGIAIYILFKALPMVNTRIVKKKTILLISGVIALIPVALIIYFSMFPQIVDRFKDTFTLEVIDDLSGRSDSMRGLIEYFKYNTEWIIVGPYGLTSYWGSSYEMTYFCILMIGGLLGLLAFLGPIIYVIVRKLLKYFNKSGIIKGVVLGVVVYLIMAYVEGALWLPPTAINLWMVLALGYKLSLYLDEENSDKKIVESAEYTGSEL